MGRANLELATSTGDDGLELEAEVELGNILMYVGRLEEALEHLDRVAELYDPARHRHHAFVFGKDPFAITRVQAAMALFALGRAGRRRWSRSPTGIAHLERFPHPFSEGWVRLGAAIVHGLRGEIAASREAAEAGLAQATIEGFPQWVAQGRVYAGWARVVQGAHDEGLEEIRAGLEIWRMGGAQLLLPWLLAAVRRRVPARGPPRGGDRGAQRGPPSWPHANGDGWCEPELLRVLGARRARRRRTARRRDRPHSRAQPSSPPSAGIPGSSCARRSRWPSSAPTRAGSARFWARSSEGPGTADVLAAQRPPAREDHTLIDVTHRRRLVALLTEAAELEHALMCQYLYAAFSMKRQVDEGVTWQQLELMRRWEASIMLIARQEMEHLGLVCNLLTAIGEAPWLTRPNLPLEAQALPTSRSAPSSSG